MQDLQRVVAFAKVVETGSFSRAAEKLGIAKSSVSKQVAALESSLGIRLIHRTTRQLKVTDEGLALYEQCSRIDEELDLIRSRAKAFQESPQGKLRIGSTPLLGNSFLAEILPEFLQRYPDLQVDLSLSNQVEDFFTSGFDIGIRIGEITDSALSGQALGPMQSYICASPSYIAQHGMPKSPTDLQNHNVVIWQPHERVVIREWLLDKGGKAYRANITGNLTMSEGFAVKQAICNGGGLGLMPSYAIKNEVANGELVIVLPEYQALKFPVFAVYPPKQNLSAKVRVFIEFIKEKLAEAKVE